MARDETYYWNREELKALNGRMELVGRVQLGHNESSVLVCLLIQMVDKLYGKVATLENEITKLIGDDGCDRCPHGVPTESYEGCRQCDPQESP